MPTTCKIVNDRSKTTSETAQSRTIPSNLSTNASCGRVHLHTTPLPLGSTLVANEGPRVSLRPERDVWTKHSAMVKFCGSSVRLAASSLLVRQDPHLGRGRQHRGCAQAGQGPPPAGRTKNSTITRFGTCRTASPSSHRKLVGTGTTTGCRRRPVSSRDGVDGRVYGRYETEPDRGVGAGLQAST